MILMNNKRYDESSAQSMELYAKQLQNKDNLGNLPKIKDNRVFHVRPKVRDSKDTISTHLGTHMVKSTFWINASYIRNSIYNN
mgnify:CR=1 FL=1